MRVLSTFDNSQSVNPSSVEAREKKRGEAGAEKSSQTRPSGPERLSRSEILSRLEKAKGSSEDKVEVTKKPLDKASWDDAGEEEAQKKADEIVGDVGKNRPDDPETKNKLKTLLGNGGFNFSAKEREALGQILK